MVTQVGVVVTLVYSGESSLVVGLPSTQRVGLLREEEEEGGDLVVR
jgi:hypothetical protein